MKGDEERASVFLSEIRKKGLGRLEPVMSTNSRLGYVYPIVAEFCGVRDGSEIYWLESLVEAGRMTKDPFASFCLCPNCRDFRVRIGEECRTCPGAHLKRVDLLHHYRCAWIAPETDFLQGLQFVCPKCRRLLEQVGVDYDRPGRFYLCSVCVRRFPEDGLTARCESCRRSFPADDLPQETVFAYTVVTEAPGG